MHTPHKIKRIRRALDQLSPHETHCTLCPQECRVNRQNGEQGFCQTGSQAKLSHALLHFGEEPVISGYSDCSKSPLNNNPPMAGSGTLFFTGCNLKCLYCQNYQLSWFNQGKDISADEIAETILSLQEKGALNINLVSPMHVLIQILRGLEIAYKKGFHLPIIYNTNAYEKVQTMRLLDGIVDVYLPDLKYSSSRTSRILSNRPDYFQFASQAVKEMYRQNPNLRFDNQNIVQEGLIIRHLFLPGRLKDTLHILKWISENISLSIGLSLMSQYVPCFRAPESLRKAPSREDYWKAVEYAQRLGYETLFIQPQLFEKKEHLIPDFDLADPFEWGQKK